MARRTSIWMAVLAMAIAGLGAAEREAPKRDASMGQVTHLISLALVVAGQDPGGESGLQPLAPAVAKAIADIKEFLPYKGYAVHDTVVLRAANLSFSRFEMQGPSARYVVRFQYQTDEDARRLNFGQFEMARATEPAAAPRASSGGAAEPETPKPAPSREVIATSFSVNVGETIVVGTSRLNGTGKALVLVLTVLPTP